MPGTELQTEVMADTAVTRHADPAAPAGPTAPSRTDDPLDGTPYRLVSPLGEGGMGEVLLAEHRSLGHVVVVKLIKSEVALGEQMLERVRVEAQAGARIRHEHLVAVHDFGTTPAGRPYLVMEYLRGQTLTERLRAVGGGPLPLREALDIAIQTLRGLAVVHRAGLVHRDVKPTNVFLCEPAESSAIVAPARGHSGPTPGPADDSAEREAPPLVKVLDLGLAKVVEMTTSATPDPLKVPTRTGVVLGTPRYMAPEQVAGSDVDGRADLYAVGLLLYRMLCGRGPFDEARSFEDILAAHVLQEPKAPSEALRAGDGGAPALPPALDALILRCLNKRPEERPVSAEALIVELQAIEDDLEQSDIFSEGFVTVPMEPATSLSDASCQWPVPPVAKAAEVAPVRRGVSLGVVGLVVLAAIVFGTVVGLVVVYLGGGGGP
ncbi:MAG: serine/threonine-protein kinase [Polyangiaceae bacterium]